MMDSFKEEQLMQGEVRRLRGRRINPNDLEAVDRLQQVHAIHAELEQHVAKREAE